MLEELLVLALEELLVLVLWLDATNVEGAAVRRPGTVSHDGTRPSAMNA